VLVSTESLLRRVPVDVETRTVLFIDGIRYSIETLDLAYERLRDTLSAFERRECAATSVGRKIVQAIGDAWMMIDSAHRLRELIQQMPQLKQREPQVQLFERNTRDIEDLRHFVQHFRSGIDGFVAKRMPLWGTLSWGRISPDTNVAECHTIVPGTFYGGVWAPSCTLDTVEWKFVDGVVLHAAGARCDLTRLFNRVADLAQWFEGWFNALFTGDNRHGSDVHFLYTIRPISAPVVNNPSDESDA
jgi:hypothetical protein